MKIERINLHPDYSISRIIKGGWHLAGGHGSIQEDEAIEDMRAFVEAGITTFDCADIYTGVEEMIGKFLRKYKAAFSAGDLPQVQVHTKYVPDYAALATLTKTDTIRIIDRSLQRLGVERLDLVQFAWWNYKVPGYVEASLHLADLQKVGKIRHIGITNFDAAHVQEILDAGVPIFSNQVQYSLLDQRVESDYHSLSKTHPIPFFCYGTVAGGFLSDRYLDTVAPTPPFENRSLTKYRLIIDEFGGYDLFQDLLKVLHSLAIKYQVGIAEIAIRYILQKEMVAGVIVGARHRGHLKKLCLINGFHLDEEDLQLIKRVTDQAQGPVGPFYELERDKTGKHGSIMKYNLNE